ncbi:hypothetical protein LUZ60_015097 [Juncus effusus]|nr:hypothetical protein LUZ60_015097 [Juncus effusus]
MMRSNTNRSSSTGRSSEFSLGSSASKNSTGSSASSPSSSKSSPKKKLSMGDIFLNCLPIPDFDDYPDTNLGSSGNSNKWKYEIKGLINSKSDIEIISGDIKFSWEEILKATKNFSKDSIIGESRCSVVYKGQLANKTLVAVKRAKQDKNKSERNKDKDITRVSFKNEIETLQQIQHINLVGFHGYVEIGDELIIILEYVPNGTLRDHLDCFNGKVLELSDRLEIAKDVAHALTHLHSFSKKPIIHRDVKSTNILITNTLHAKVADFGFARLASTEPGVSVVHTQVKGTLGYIDPQYFITNELNEKSDVYSFGVLLVELISGRFVIEPNREKKERLTIEWALDKLGKGKASEVLDPILDQTSAASFAAERILELADKCLSKTRKPRPDMKTCSEILWDITKDYNALLNSEKEPQL